MTTLYYLYDPLCGWCYGATPAVACLHQTTGVTVTLLPTALFAGEGARPMDDDFAAYAWTNDQRIERLTGQPFTERYRRQVLGDRQRLFDSGPATVALTAVALTGPQQELAALKAIQHARYVDGQDVTSLEVLAGVLRAAGLDAAAQRLAAPDAALLDVLRERSGRARALMQQFGARGVPTFITETAGQRRILQSPAIYTDPQALVSQLAA
ncbi:DsbA family protein [Paracoccus kondratievae]|uniref:DsbA family protein n=1 Tax=Paracoccus kondratievae TaxID=135740 RepID=A0AAD3RS31_9RHOB|nr:DsbA family protein [Paracoccus kondratievae]GLK62537.1 DsbA family protein [Paracoccus kondratievae]